MKTKVCESCNKERPANKFRLRRNAQVSYNSKICMYCEPSPFFSAKSAKNPRNHGDRNKSHKGPFERVYFEHGMKVIVLPPSNGSIF